MKYLLASFALLLLSANSSAQVTIPEGTVTYHSFLGGTFYGDSFVMDSGSPAVELTNRTFIRDIADGIYREPGTGWEIEFYPDGYGDYLYFVYDGYGSTQGYGWCEVN